MKSASQLALLFSNTLKKYGMYGGYCGKCKDCRKLKRSGFYPKKEKNEERF